MKFKAWFSVLIVCILTVAVTLAACNPIPSGDNTPPGGNPGGELEDPSDNLGGGEIPDDNDVVIAEPDTTAHDFVLKSSSDGTFTYKCSDCNKEISVVISCDSGTANAYTVEGNTITFSDITAKSTYDISGVFYGNIVIDVTDDYKFELQMSGLELYSYTECPVSVLSGDSVTISAKKSTDNFIYDMRDAVTDSDATSSSIYALCDLNIQGKGTLNVKSLHNNGIHTKKDLAVKNLALQVDCIDNALKGNDNVTIEAGTIVLISRQGDGIKTSNSDVSKKGNQRGTVAITGGDILIYAACDGINAAYDVNIDESSATVTMQIFTDKYSKYCELTSYTTFITSNAPGGPGGGVDDGNKDKGDYSTKGIKADNQIIISAGAVTVSAYDDAIHASNDASLENGETALGNVTISGGSITLLSNDDAIHADNKVTISGGVVTVVSSYEGIEANTVDISNGNVTIVSSDDGINATATSGTAITIAGGNVYVYAGGDGLDSNSQTSNEGIHFAGGTSVIISIGQSDSSIDTEHGYKYTGGYVIGIGRSGTMGSEATNCSDFSSVGTSETLKLQKDSYLVVEGIATVKMPASLNALVVCLGKTNASISQSSSTSYTLDENGVYWNVA